MLQRIKGIEITIAFDFTWNSLRNGIECACSQMEECQVYKWYNERKKLSDSFLKNNKPENVKEERIIEKKKPPIIEMNEKNAPPIERKYKNKPLSREEKKIMAYVQTIDRMEQETKGKSYHKSERSPSRNSIPLKTSTNRNIPHGNSPLNKKKRILSLSSQGVQTNLKTNVTKPYPSNTLRNTTLSRSNNPLNTHQVKPIHPSSKTNRIHTKKSNEISSNTKQLTSKY